MRIGEILTRIVAVELSYLAKGRIIELSYLAIGRIIELSYLAKGHPLLQWLFTVKLNINK